MNAEKLKSTEGGFSGVDLFEDDDEFEEFDVFETPKEKEEDKKLAQQWENDWDDDDVNADFSLQLRKELEG